MGDDTPPLVSWSQTIGYEAHVKGLTARHPDVIEAQRGTYAGLTSEPVIDHVKRLGITTVELMPVHHFVNDSYLVEKGLTNYWGYNSIGYFAPESLFIGWRAGSKWRSSKAWSRRSHAAGLEVILDALYNSPPRATTWVRRSVFAEWIIASTTTWSTTTSAITRTSPPPRTR